MKIGTYNIDWGKTYKSRNNISAIEAVLKSIDFNILVITESVILNLDFPHIYTTRKIPSDRIFENLDYGKYLNYRDAFRVCVYSKYPAAKILNVSDEYTSLALQIETEIGQLNIYSTIVGTWFNKLPYVKTELDNCLKDCLEIYKLCKSVCLIGDLNTSFSSFDTQYQINTFTTKELKNLAATTKMEISTSSIEHNIDHIFLPHEITSKYLVVSQVFIEKDKLSDHPGIIVNIHTLANSG